MTKSRGRPTKLTPNVQRRIVTAITLGAPMSLAAAYAGVSPDAAAQWVIRGNEVDAKDPYKSFAQAVLEAEGSSAIGLLAKIEAAANEGEWRAAAWKLERRYPQLFGRQSLEVVGKDGEDLQSNIIVYLPSKEDPPTDNS